MQRPKPVNLAFEVLARPLIFSETVAAAAKSKAAAATPSASTPGAAASSGNTLAFAHKPCVLVSLHSVGVRLLQVTRRRRRARPRWTLSRWTLALRLESDLPRKQVRARRGCCWLVRLMCACVVADLEADAQVDGKQAVHCCSFTAPT
jgi:hypothetical protein